MNFIVRGATVVTQNSRRVVKRADLLIEGNRFSKFLKTGSKVRGAKVVEAHGLHLFPGFIQAHTHLCQTLFRNMADDLELLDWLSKRIWRFEAAHSAQSLRASADVGIWECLRSGTTTVLDMGTVRHTEQILEAVQSAGIRASVGKCLMDHPKTTPPNLRESADQALGEALDLYRDWNGRAQDRIRVSFAPRFAVSCTSELLKKVGDAARARHALVHTHACENRKEIALVKKLTGLSNLRALERDGILNTDLVLAHGVWLTPADMDLLKKRGTAITHCPSSNLKLASGRAPILELRRRGIPVALGADGAACNNGLSIFQEMRLAALLHKPDHGPKALPAREILDMATREGARALRWSDSIGSVEPGKKADFTLIDLKTPSNLLPDAQTLDLDSIASSLVYSSGPENVVSTYVDGKRVAHRGVVKTLPSAALLHRVRDEQSKLLKRLSR